MTKIKICGLKSEQDISFANELKPDYVGFVFLKGKARYVSPTQAAQLRKLLDPEIPAVGVFVNEPPENVIALLQEGTIQIAQLHGKEDALYVKKLRSTCKNSIIKAFVIKSETDLENALSFPSDYLLFDNGQGTGKVFNWSLIKNGNRPFFLAGGLTPENIEDAITTLHPFGVDVSSGVETDGKKDYDKIKTFINNIRLL